MTTLQQILNGLVLGHIYALLAVGWTILLGVCKLVNFAHGQIYMMGAFVAWYVMARLGAPYWLATLAAVGAGAAIGYVIQRVLLPLTIKRDLVSIMIATLGIGYILTGSAAMMFGSIAQIMETPLSTTDFQVGDIWISYQEVVIIVVAILIFVSVHALFRRTQVGRLARMVAEDPHLAQLAGVNIRHVYLAVFCFEGAAVSLAAALIAPRVPLQTSMGFEEVIATFVVVVVGGIGSIWGSYVAGLALGIFTALFSAFVSPVYTTGAVFVALIGLLLVRPGGLGVGAQK